MDFNKKLLEQRRQARMTQVPNVKTAGCAWAWRNAACNIQMGKRTDDAGCSAFPCIGVKFYGVDDIGAHF